MSSFPYIAGTIKVNFYEKKTFAAVNVETFK